MNSAELSEGPKESSPDADFEDRASSGKAAGPSGRCHAVQEAGETWDQDDFAQQVRKPTSVMVEYPAGSNVWYNGVPQKWSSRDVLFRIGVECREEAPCVWIRLTSSRIWRGSNAANTWKYSGRGAWKPKGGRAGKRDTAAKAKPKLRKRKSADDKQGSEAQNDDVTCTTKATVQPESDEEDAIEQCPSPVPFKGSNAVSPEGEGHKPGFGKKQEEQDGADMLKVLADKLVCKQEGEHSKDSLLTGAVDLKYSAWMYRHYRLLQKQGQLDLAPEGCNPEAGRSLGSAFTSSEQEESLRLKETSSSSGSARLKQEASHNGAAKKWGFRQSLGSLPMKGEPDLVLARSRSKPMSFEIPRSPSPSTPSKPADETRRQRSSSADLDPRSHTAGQSLNEKQVQKGGKYGDIPAEHSSKQQPARRDQSATNGAQAHKIAKESPTSGKKALGRNFSAAETGRDTKFDGKDVKANKRTRAEPSSKQANGGALRASKRQLGTNAKQTEAEWSAPSTLSNPMDSHALGHRHSTPQKGQAAAQLPALVETDPFATNDIIRCKAC